MTEESKRQWDILLGAIAPVITLVAILLGVWQFNTGEKNRQAQEAASIIQRDRLEFHRRLWLEKVEVYRQVAELTGEVIAAHEIRGPAADQAYGRFVKTYWGAMMLVEDYDVERAMIAFQAELIDFRSGWTTDLDRLKVRADTLLTACRKSIENDGKGLNTPPASRT